MAPEGFREVVEQQAAAVKALEIHVQEQKQREQDLFERVQLLTEKLADAQMAEAVTVQVCVCVDQGEGSVSCGGVNHGTSMG